MGNQCKLPTFSSLPAQKNFDLCRFLGIWYEIKWFKTEIVTDVWSDFVQSFDLQDHNKQRLIVYGQARNATVKNCFPFGPMSLDASHGARMILITEDVKNGPIDNWPFLIIQTDYDNYALAYFCTSKNYQQNKPCEERQLKIYGRKTTLADKYLKLLLPYVNNRLCVSPEQLRTTVHSEKSCPIQRCRNCCKRRQFPGTRKQSKKIS